jgi:hypothetical protein
VVFSEQVQEKRLSQFKLDCLWRFAFPVDDGNDLDANDEACPMERLGHHDRLQVSQFVRMEQIVALIWRSSQRFLALCQ